MEEKEKGWIKFFNISKNYGFIVYGENDSQENCRGEGGVPLQTHPTRERCGSENRVAAPSARHA